MKKIGNLLNNKLSKGESIENLGGRFTWVTTYGRHYAYSGVPTGMCMSIGNECYWGNDPIEDSSGGGGGGIPAVPHPTPDPDF